MQVDQDDEEGSHDDDALLHGMDELDNDGIRVDNEARVAFAELQDAAQQAVDHLKSLGEEIPEWLLCLIKLDAFHAMRRVTGTLKKRHLAFPTFCCRLRDAVFIMFRPDVDAVKGKIKELLAL